MGARRHRSDCRGSPLGLYLATTVVLTPAGAPSAWSSIPVGLLTAGVVLFAFTRRPALAHWRSVDEQRGLWKPRWESLKVSAHLMDYTEHGFFTISTFETRSAADVIKLGPKVVSAIGGGSAVALIAHPNLDSDGKEVPGSTHPNRLRIVTWPANEAPGPAISEATDDESVRLVLHTAVWESRWSRMKKWEGHPIVVGFEEVAGPEGSSPVSVTTFDLPQSLPMTAILDTPRVLADAVGQFPHGFSGAFAASPDTDPSTGQPVPGTQSGTRFQYIEAPTEASVADPSASLDFVYQLLRVQLWTHAVEVQARAPEITDLVQVSGTVDEDGTLALSCWRATLTVAHALSVPPAVIRAQWRDSLSEGLGALTLLRGSDVITGGFDYDGFVFASDAAFSDGSRLDLAALEKVVDEDEWTTRWARLFDDNPGKVPSMRHEASQTRTLATGVDIHQRAFVTRQNQSLADVMKTEQTLSSVLAAAPFAALDYMPDGRADRPGYRHPMGVAVRFSKQPVPTQPDVLPPVPMREDRKQTAAMWVLSAQIRGAFAAAKLAHPQLYAVAPLSSEDSPSHLWQLWLRLHDGVTLAEVRKQAPIIRRHLGSKYLRVGEDGDVITVVIGARPENVTLLRPESTDEQLAVMDWEQAFLDAGVRNAEGITPTLSNFRRLKKNPDVMIVDFDLPAGIDSRRVKAVVDKLAGPTGYGFIQVQPGEGAGTVQIMCSRENPMPKSAPYDPEVIADTDVDLLPFAVGLDGEPIVFDVKQNTHLMVLGGQGSGKSVGLQAIINPAVMKDYDLYVADPMKGAADFQYLRPWSKAFVDTEVEDGGLFHVVAMLKSVYTTVVERKQLNQQHGVGNYRDLPADVRPHQALVVIDEFTSLIMLDPEPKASSDPEVEAERDKILAKNGAKKELAVYVGKIIREARSVGVSMMLATQKITSDMMKGLAGTNDMKANTSTLVLGKSKDTDRAAAGMNNPYDVPELGESVAKGRGLYESNEAGVQMVQIWFEPGGQGGMADLVAGVREPLADDEKIDYTPFLRLPQIQEGPAVEMLPPEETVVQDLGDLDLDLGDDWLSDLNLDETEDVGEGEADDSEAPQQADDEPSHDGDEDDPTDNGLEPVLDDTEEANDDSYEAGQAQAQPPAEEDVLLIDESEVSEVDTVDADTFVPDIPTIADDDDLFATPQPRASRDASDMFAAPKPKKVSTERF
jgi:S-DNA-T family DNA segregation ATPase FtsK/SpoIIIE